MQDDIQNQGIGAQGDPTIGTPEEDTGTWDGQQSYDDTCAIRCQEYILEQFTNLEIDETALVQEAQSNGWYQPGTGTLPEDVGKVLEAHGFEVNQYQNATPNDLAKELAQGHKVIIGVDSGELSGGENPILQDIVANADVDADHAVVVSGIDTTDPNNPQVTISDPGTGEATATYPLDQFLAAWQDSSFFMTATEEPAPSTLPEMANFDYEAGHIPEVMGVPYEDFLGGVYDEAIDAIPSPAEIAMDIQSTMGPSLPPAVDPALIDPTLPGPTLDPALFDPNMPGPTLDPALFDPNTPGPTLDPALFDPTMPAPIVDPYYSMPPDLAELLRETDQLISETQQLVNETDAQETSPHAPMINPALFDPTAPGPTLDPALFDPTAPGPTVNPSLLNPAAPGPALDPSLLDPTMPGPTIDPSMIASPYAPAYDPSMPINPGDGVFTSEEVQQVSEEYSDPYND